MTRCLWCHELLTATQLRWCSTRCRQTAWRARRTARVEGRSHLGAATSPGTAETPLHLAYADPPYPGLAYYYRDQPTFGGEVDHARLLEVLTTYDGWALSTSRESLRDILSLAAALDAASPEYSKDIVVCPWVKTHHHARARGPSCIHEYLLVKPARRRFPGVPDALVASVARGGDSDLIGRKPLRFVQWMLALMGALPIDSLDDLYPGSGVVGRCWSEFVRASSTARSDTPSASNRATSLSTRVDSDGMVGGEV